MVDIFTPEKRSWLMSQIRSKNTGIELKMEKIILDLKCDYDIHPKMFGSPDFFIKRKGIVIFCDGDFWHGYKYDTNKKPAKLFWRNKIENNIRRDMTVNRKLRRDGWSVLRFWEHDINKRPDVCRKRILRKLSETS